jgi:hypothetical protein
LAFSLIFFEISISTAPPPGINYGFVAKFLQTARASCKFLSISLRVSFDPPLKMIEQAHGFLQSTKYVKYSSPIYLTSKRPQPVPISDS